MAIREVNLVPDALLHRRYFRRHAVGWAVAYGAAVALLLGASIAFLQRLTALGRTTGNEAEIRKRLVATIATIEERKEGFARLAFVREISCPVGVAQVLGRLAETMDPGTWLTHLTLTVPQGSEMEVGLDGLARSNSQLGTTVNALAKSEAFRDVVLGNATEVNASQYGVKSSNTLIRFSARAKAVVE
jgi:Tfp pilus assembly protein PilN